MRYYAHGKLLISGEYLVLNGALALAIPARFGQSLEVMEKPEGNDLHWISRDHQGKTWADVVFSKKDLQAYRETLKTIDAESLEFVQQLLQFIRIKHPAVLQRSGTVELVHTLEFDRNWGLGSSSTLIANMAAWSGMDAFELNNALTGGSGYDIACAISPSPVLYKIDGEGPVFDTVNFTPPQPEQLFFIHLNQKQNSKAAVEKFKAGKGKYENEIEIISEISEALLFCDDFGDFIQLLDEHEEVMQFVLQEEKIKSARFPDFHGAVKSLGAWGGDFILAASEMPPADIKKYFQEKGFPVILGYNEMALK